MKCSIFTKELYKDISDFSSFAIQFNWLRNLIPPFNPNTSGVWLPIIINNSNSNIQFVDILSRSSGNTDSFDPCNCLASNPIDFYRDIDPENQTLECSYCNKEPSERSDDTPITDNYSFNWNLTDNNPDKLTEQAFKQSFFRSIEAKCCAGGPSRSQVSELNPIGNLSSDGACDVRMYKDDYLTKLPVLNNSYLNKFYDWKYKLQFPASSNPGLGYENFARGNSFTSLSSDTNLELVIDWKIKERIGEIPPNGIDTYHTDIDTHEQSYARSLGNSKTCGNFLLLSLHSSSGLNPEYPIFTGLISGAPISSNYKAFLPPVEKFVSPYGFQNEDYYNIFVNKEKLGSYWKWNYNSGILCWYRYYDITRPQDEEDRLIPGVELYISEGDVFYATNDGPEPSPASRNENTPEIKACPSGLKLIKNNAVTGIIPSGSNFLYISTNLYQKTYTILDKLTKLESDLNLPTNLQAPLLQKLQLASLLATGPDYHEVTVDFFKLPVTGIVISNNFNMYNFVLNLFGTNTLNKDMSTASQSKANALNIVKTKEDLINTLVNKYGCYIWCPPNTETNISFNTPVNPHCYIDLDFEPVVKLADTTSNIGCSPSLDCFDSELVKNFNYAQKISVGNLSLRTNIDKKYYNQSCEDGNFTITGSARIMDAYFNDTLVKQTIYGKDCTVFYQKYLRAPSYDLALQTMDEILCSSYGFCNEQLARKFNINNGWFNTPNELRAGKFEDKSVILERKYRANYSNVNINRIGFHKDGGCYFDSNTLGKDNVVFASVSTPQAGNCSINFTTKDVGIKIYNIRLHKLRDANNSNCKTFPLDQTCKCFPLVGVTGYEYNCDGKLRYTNNESILFTPNISTQISPTIKSYGGYTDNEINNMIGSQRIPNHPAPGSIIPVVDRIIDPLNPYECVKNITITLPNYIRTKWNLFLSEYTTNHSDVWVRAIDNSNIFPSQTIIDPESDDQLVLQPPRRYTTKAQLNNISVFYNQEKILFHKNTSATSNIGIELINPYLSTLLSVGGDYSFEKYPYTNMPCSVDTNNRDPDLLSINLSFIQFPRKQVLNFRLEPINSLGTISKTFFHPNSGLIEPNDRTSLVYNSKDCSIDFNYESSLFNNRQYSNSGVMFSGTINDGVKHILNLNNSLLNHKKLRLYLKYNNIWYEYLNPHLFGFDNKINNNLYPGYPLYFEYVSKNLSNIFPSQLIPAAPKKNTPLFYIQNFMPTGQIPNLVQNSYPLIYSKFQKYESNKIILKGSRPYFLLPEKTRAIEVDSLEFLSDEQQEQIILDKVVQETSGRRWKYKGTGSKISYSSYEPLPIRKITDHNFSDLFFDLANDADLDGYVHDSKATIEDNTFITLYDQNNVNRSSRYKILKKSLYAKSVDKYGNVFNQSQNLQSSKHLNVFTLLELEVCETCSLLDSGIAQIDKKSFTVLQNFAENLVFENSSLLSNLIYDTKWGDVINFDKKLLNDLTNSQILQNELQRLYPDKPLYENILQKITLNNLSKNNFIYRIGNTNYTHTGSVYYNIHQKYNINLNDKYYSSNIQSYQNFLPIMDINLVTQPNDQNFLTQNAIQTGIMYISGIRSFIDTTELSNDPDTSNSFFISLDKNALLKPVIFNKSFYNDTLRSDDTYFRLASLGKTTNQNSAGCTSIIQPNIDFPVTAFPNYFGNNGFSSIIGAKNTIKILPIYCNADNPKNYCEGANGANCSIRNIGSVSLWSQYYHDRYNYITANQLPNNIEYCLSIDEGLYNNISYKTLPYIQRFEIPPGSPLFKDSVPTINSCHTNQSYRPDNPKYIDSEYQNTLSSYVLNDGEKGDLVKNTDILANEMLFRLLYGSKQEISYETIKKKTVSEFIKDNNKKSISYLVQYSNPRTTADKIYDLIPYDYSTSADSSRRKINGNITIKGVLSVGSLTRVSIDGNSISIAIRNVSGKIMAVASCNGKEYFGLIKDTRNRVINGLFGQPKTSPAPSPSGPNITLRKVTTCKGGISPTDWGLTHYYSGATYTDSEGKQRSIEAEYNACVAARDKPYDPDDWSEARKRGIIWAGFDGFKCMQHHNSYGTSFTDAVFEYVPWPFGVGCVGASCAICDNRKVGSGFGALPPGCSVVAGISGKVSIGGIARGIFNNGSCAARIGKATSLSPSNRVGDFDSLIGGTVLISHGFVPYCKTKASPCSPCLSLDSTDKFGKIFDMYRFSGTSDVGSLYGYTTPCECQHSEFGYCTPAQQTDPKCQCRKYASGFPKIFDYNFEYCNYQFNSMKGYIIKYDNDGTIQSDGKGADPIECLSPPNVVPTDSSGSATDNCSWIECKQPAPPDIDVYLQISTNPQPYEPKCPEQLCYIAYDNNKINIILPGGTVGCFDVNIRNYCPVIDIILPNNTFSFSDSINSECTMCDVENNKIVMNPEIQNPNWDIVEETRTCILGYLPIEGNTNSNVITVGAVWADKELCGDTQLCCNDDCFTKAGGLTQCGASGGGSRPRIHALICPYNGSRGPIFTKCIGDGTLPGGVVNVLTPVDLLWAKGSDNGIVKQRHINYWKSLMTMLYEDVSVCRNNIGSFPIDDLVEGVVPGSCSALSYKLLYYPAISVSQDEEGGSVSNATFGVWIAYFTYKYRRPRTIQDILLKEKASICSTILPSCPTNSYNITEKYAVPDCGSTPLCFDIVIPTCATNNYCCQHQKQNSVPCQNANALLNPPIATIPGYTAMVWSNQSVATKCNLNVP